MFISVNMLEVYGVLIYGFVMVKYLYGMINLFGMVDSKNSGYFDVMVNFDFGDGMMLLFYVGY